MKTKFYWVALLASAAMIAQANAGGHHGGGGGIGGGFGGGFAGGRPAPARGGAYSSYHPMPTRSFGGGTIYPGPHYSSFGMRSAPATFRPYYVNPNVGRQVGTRQFTPGNSSRGDRLTQFSNRGNQAVTNLRNNRTGAGQFHNGNNNLRSDWRNHVFAHHSADWHRDWDRGRDHWWHGHRVRFIDGSWVLFDFGFYPWWAYGYPYDYYAYGDYPYGYGYYPGYYDSGEYDGEDSYYGQNTYDSSAPDTDSTIAAAQERLAQQGYYGGDIDGVLGSETRRAIGQYQSKHGLRVTGFLTADTLQALGLRGVATN